MKLHTLIHRLLLFGLISFAVVISTFAVQNAPAVYAQDAVEQTPVPATGNPEPLYNPNCSTDAYGKNQGSSFYSDTLGLMGISVSQFALDAFAQWQPYENTEACWNPLATTYQVAWFPSGTGCTETIFNGVGVRNYSSKYCGELATARTLLYSGTGAYYKPIRDMLSQASFNWQAIHDSIIKWVGSESYATSITNGWQTLWNNRGNTNNPPAGFTKCADEGGRCNFSGTADVVYGARSSFTSPRSFTNGVDCNNSVFGDPISGVSKACYYKPTTSSSNCPNVSYNGVILYDSKDCSGNNRPYNTSGPRNLPELGFNDATSSMYVASGWSVKVYEHDHGTGSWRCWAQSPWDLSKDYYASGNTGLVIDNTITSIEVFTNGSCSGSYFGKVFLYDNSNYTGDWASASGAGLWTVESVFNDRAESIYIPPTWSVRAYKDNSVSSPNACFRTSDINLGDNSFSDGSSVANQITWFDVYLASDCPVTTPSAPTLNSPGNGATLNRSDTVSLSWNTASGASSYYAEFWGGPGLNLNSGWTSNTSWSLGSQWGGSYQWRVKARSSGGESPTWSETRTLRIKYGSPSGLSASAASTSQINLSWSPSADGPGNIDGYRVYRNGSPVGTTGSSVTTYGDSGLSSGTSYSYTVRAYKGSVESDPSNTASATTNSPACFTLNVTINPAGAGSVLKNPAPNCSGTQYTPGTVVQLTASPYGNYYFSSWSGDAGGSANPVSVSMNGSRSVTANFTAPSLSRKVFVPMLVKPGVGGAGINGRVLQNGSAAGGVPLDLFLYSASTSTLKASATTRADGTYAFTGMPSLGSGESYYVRFLNSAITAGRLWLWETPLLTTYTAGSSVKFNDFDIGDVYKGSPESGAAVSLPAAFTWTRRTATPTDSYELDLIDQATGYYLWWTNPALGYASSYQLASLPSGLSVNTPYYWEIWIYSPDGGVGIGLYIRQVTFTTTGTGLQAFGSSLPAKLRPLEQVAPEFSRRLLP